MDVFELLLYLSIVLMTGYLFGKIAEHYKIPEITGYLIVGVILGPSVLGVIGEEAISRFHVISNVVLGIIAYQIGTELWLPKLKKSGRQIIVITLAQALFTAIIVVGGVLIIDGRLWLALVLGGIAVATAPAPIMVMVKKLKAKGELTDTVIPIVGIDDMIGVIIFAILSSIAIGLVDGGPIPLSESLMTAIKEVVLSIGGGIGGGLVLGLFSRYIIQRFDRDDRYVAYLTLSLSFILLSIWIAHTFHLSMILLPMAIGMTFTNMIPKETFKIQGSALNNFAGPLVILFFTIAGIELSLEVLMSAGIIALVYIVMRTIGKIGGSYVGAKMCGASKKVRNSIGFCLLPQSGVAIGMIVAVVAAFPDAQGQLVQTVVLAGILIFELVGPAIFKFTLEYAGESRKTNTQLSSPDHESIHTSSNLLQKQH
ncbi:MAG: cation:proton antiporter [Bacillota bacterium]